ncbi:hypothetical protein ASPVEDRAFT_66629 [Aspergillus versicolor CBS 583.65]|uniref:C2H2-type domain-containing protein n=1 Tax=Aspergillus versicolor CBS 583.65 TaxID=1036611 RepID=A0A1L9Q4R6_ASPVE|nr:uncharacterized protein ASPVEDRAFT_66629 [Aspergillus versicolor CBS 583.65]OJJ08764.1 hypothetical protein ASPVEDRAFT_66629 [Aspergillus versicolor CBS 583.65]
MEDTNRRRVASPSNNDLASTPVKKYHCGQCSASFHRREHLQRHQRSHSQSKDFHCHVCDKRFSRRDTLQRHLATHGQVPVQLSTASPRASRACTNCVKSKQRCRGPQPCERCTRRGWRCTIPHGPAQSSADTAADLQDAPDRPDDHPCQNTANGTVADCSDGSSGLPTTSLCHPETLDLPGVASTQPYPALAFPDGTDDPTASFESFFLWPLGSDCNLDMPYVQQDAALSSGDALQYHSAAYEQVNSTSDVPDIDVSESILEEQDRDILISEDYGHIPKPSRSTYDYMCTLAAGLINFPPASHLRLPDLDILHICVQLYFEHFHKTFPLLHQGTFVVRAESWLLYCAVAAVGSQYSRFSNRNAIFSTLLDIIRKAMLCKIASGTSLQNDLALAQTMVLLDMCLILGGTREGIMYVQYQRNILVTMCRPLLGPSLLFKGEAIPTSGDLSVRDWARWALVESWKRVVYFAWFGECIQQVFFDMTPLIRIEDMQLDPPCQEELWQARTFNEWERVKDTGKYQQSNLNLFDLFQTGAISATHIQPLSDVTLIAATFAIHTGERQAARQQEIHRFYSIFNKSQREDRQDRQDSAENDETDSILARLQEASWKYTTGSHVLRITYKFATLFRLLHFIRYRLMYIAAGWMTEPQEVEATAQKISHFLRTEPQQARHGLVHAARIFRIIRSQSQLDPADPIVLLMAVLYIWYYDRFVVPEQRQSANEGRGKMLRVDQDLDEDVVQDWIKQGGETTVQLHITGLGVLNGRDSVSRVLREAVKTLQHANAWSQLANAIGYAVSQMLSGETLSFSD